LKDREEKTNQTLDDDLENLKPWKSREEYETSSAYAAELAIDRATDKEKEDDFEPVPDVIRHYHSMDEVEYFNLRQRLIAQGYTDDWAVISTCARREVRWICQQCGADLSRAKSLLHVHHKDGSRQNNAPSNLVVLCSLCHSECHDSARMVSENVRRQILRARRRDHPRICELLSDIDMLKTAEETEGENRELIAAIRQEIDALSSDDPVDRSVRRDGSEISSNLVYDDALSETQCKCFDSFVDAACFARQHPGWVLRRGSNEVKWSVCRDGSAFGETLGPSSQIEPSEQSGKASSKPHAETAAQRISLQSLLSAEQIARFFTSAANDVEVPVIRAIADCLRQNKQLDEVLAEKEIVLAENQNFLTVTASKRSAPNQWEIVVAFGYLLQGFGRYCTYSWEVQLAADASIVHKASPRLAYFVA